MPFGGRPGSVSSGTITTPASSARASALLLKLVDGLFNHPAITVPGAARELKVTQRAAAQNVGKLVQAGILAEATDRARNRTFVAGDIIRAIEEDLPPTGE